MIFKRLLMNFRNLTFLTSLLFISFSCSVFQPSETSEKSGRVEADYRLMFYNVENLFDTEDDPLKDDQEFLPNSEKAWTYDRYQKKLNNIASVTIGIGNGRLPDIIGLCEVENRAVLEDLLEKTLLKKSDYRIIHKESPDERGIDVAVFYRQSTVKPLYFEALNVDLGEGSRPTRDILYFKCLLKNDTLHYFVNHWPSRSGGEEASAPKRAIAAKTLHNKVQEILKVDPNASIVLTGDFNDDPLNESLSNVLGAGNPSDSLANLVNLALPLQLAKKTGTLKYRGTWNYFDQFIVSRGLMNQHGLETMNQNYQIYSGPEENPFLLEDDTRNTGKQPFRTYFGKTYHDGFSDHLPVYLDLVRMK
jgi:predicted extracellular nuclease